ncbi:MAG: hypothetical protein APF78_06080 [Sphingomonadales bacterium BRH_c3]|nr:MAG: hypothetical protein APF78_06080 [Sphingomonadales bacterium BRH_c3]
MTVARLSREACSLWQFSLAVYEQPQVPPACLMLQDCYGVDVNLLLYAGWRAWRGDALSDAGCVSALRRSDIWRQELVFPLRALRRRAGDLARENPGFAQAYAAVKSCELELEKQQQAMLADGWVHDQGAEADIATTLQVFAASMGIIEEGEVKPALATITAAMESIAR